MAMFKRYNTIDEEDLAAAQHPMDIYMDTKAGRQQLERM
jgi:hypothetical protein